MAGGGRGVHDDDAAAADKRGERWMDRIGVAKTRHSLGLTAAGTSDVFIFFSA